MVVTAKVAGGLYLPDQDRVVWLSAYLVADTAAGIWNRSTQPPAPWRAMSRQGLGRS
jgi:hypothetical protein